LPQTGTFLVAVLPGSTDGSKARMLGAHWLDGKLIGYYVVDPAQSPVQQNLKGEPFVDGNVIKATFPWSAVSDLGAIWNWTAGTSVEGEDVDDCPEPGPDMLHPKTVPFPSS
jgi:hypothetical protein